eukprot:1926689-Alexandrium_andersonii.AAC.1
MEPSIGPMAQTSYIGPQGGASISGTSLQRVLPSTPTTSPFSGRLQSRPIPALGQLSVARDIECHASRAEMRCHTAGHPGVALAIRA